MSQTVRSPTLDAKFRALSDPLRRHAVWEIADGSSRNGGRISPASLVPDGAEAGEHKSTLVELQHVHLPHLADRGFVEWDAAEGTVRRGPAFDELLSLLEATAACEDAR